MTDPVAASRDPALIQWMDQHRRHVLQLTYHVISMLYGLSDGDEHALAAAIAARAELGRAAGEVARHLAESDLLNTAPWRQFDRLSGFADPGGADGDPWRTAYRAGGAESMRHLAPELEAAAAELEHPPPEHHGAAPWQDREMRGLYWFPEAVRNLHELVHQARAALTTLREHPHDEHARDAARQAWAELTQAGVELATHLQRSVDFEQHVSLARVKGVRSSVDVTAGLFHGFIATATSAEVVDAAALDGRQDVAAAVHLLEEALWHMAGYLNSVDPG